MRVVDVPKGSAVFGHINVKIISSFISTLEKSYKSYFFYWNGLYALLESIPYNSDLGTSIDLKSVDKEVKAVTPEKSKICVTAFIERLVTNF